MNPKHYELRFIERPSVERNSFSFFEEQDEKITLLDLVKTNDHILLLGNPGIGKTTELKETFHKLWASKDESGIIPLYLNIKSFRQTSRIEDLIQFDDWMKKPSIVFFFDGLDEISNIQDFISELTNFMSIHSKLALKFVISCRTNIYQKYLVKLTKFTTAYLIPLTYAQIDSIFLNKYNLTISAFEVEKYAVILQIPFNIDLFASYYLENREFPATIKEALELTLDKQIEIAREKLSGRFIHLTKSEIYNALEEVALTNELMQQNAINERYLFRLLNANGIALFQELPFIQNLEPKDHYIFNHKNYQEYFAAKKISEWNSTKIIEFIKADEINKVKPSLFNTTTFLINLLNGEKFETVKQWLLQYDIEILFFADDNRIDDKLKNEIFAKYFTATCIEKTFWIDNNPKISVETLAKFAEFELLLSILKNQENTHRVRASALEVISKKHLTTNEIATTKELFILLLNEKDDSLTAAILRAIKSQNFHKDHKFLGAVLEEVKGSENKDVCHQIISILGNLEEKDRDNPLYISTIKSFYSTYDNTVRGTEFIIASSILNTEDGDLNLSLIELLFDERYNLRSNTFYLDNFENRLLERITKLSIDPVYQNRFAEIVFSGYRIMSSTVLQKIMANIEITSEMIVHVLHSGNFTRDILYNISSYLGQDSIDAIVKGYVDKTIEIDSGNIESLRNWVANSNYKLGLYLEQEFSAVGFIFPDFLQTEEEIDTKRKLYKEFQLENFELLFDKQRLIKKIQEYFEINQVESLVKAEFLPLFYKWYDETGYHGIQYTVHTVIESSFRDERNVTVAKIKELLEKPYFYLSIIKRSLSHSSIQQFKLQSSHLALIQDLSDKIANEVDFGNVIHSYVEDPGRFRATEHFLYIKLLLFFDINYDIKLNKDFYLNLVDVGNVGGNQIKDEGGFIDFILARVNEKSCVDERIIMTITNGRLNIFSREEYIEYALDQNLVDTYESIGKLIISESNFNNRESILEKYKDKLEEPITFLKECCINPQSYLYWQAIKLIKSEGDNEYILKAALDYLKTSHLQFADDAISILFFVNDQNALRHYFNLTVRLVADNPDSSGIMPKDVDKYDNLNELYLFPSLFELIYTPSAFGTFYLYEARKLMSYLTENFSKMDGGYEKLKDVLTKIKNHIENTASGDELDHKLFYINELIEISNNSHLKSKSEGLPFDKVFRFVKE